ncbi:MAG: hypothetical protein ISS48_01135 [Candidatus Aenigmarchaeota archaeon]|nr:hypothetical protein [Candidatus Aenigmarchaeota archaeon]
MKWSIFLLVVIMVPSLVLAGTISLTTSITTDILTADQGQIQVILTNSGDEAAYNVQLSLITDYFSSQPVHVGTLEVNKPFKTNISFNTIDELKEGNYPIVLLTEYKDANGYEFSSVSPVTLTHKNSYYSKINISFENLEISGNKAKNLFVKLKNMDQTSHNINVRLALPNELSSDIVNSTVNLDPKMEKTIVFKISNFRGLEGSSYIVFVTTEYEDDYHYSSLARGMVRIVEGKGLNLEGKSSSILKLLPITILIIAILVFILYQFKGKKFEIKVVRDKK